MAKKKDAPADDTIAMEALLAALAAPNTTYAPAIETARLDAAELILKLAQPVIEDEAIEDTLKFLRRTVRGAIASLGASHRARAAGILIRYKRGGL